MNLASYIDHTFLKADGEKDAIRTLCAEAKKYKFASVCVNPCDVGLAKKYLKKSDVAVCTVIGFPLGQNTFSVKVAEARDAISHGASELDFVINVRLLKYDSDACLAELEGIVSAVRSYAKDITLKLIIECCYLTNKEKVLACKLAKKAGFDFVKTSTGFGLSGATKEDVKLMRRTVGSKMGVKAAGGIRTLEQAMELIEAGANRLGCSASVAIVTFKK